MALLRRPRDGSTTRPVLARALGVLAAGVALLGALVGAASLSLVPGQLDDAGRQACAATLGVPGPAERTAAVDAARQSGERGLRAAAGRGSASSDQDFDAVQHWCASND